MYSEFELETQLDEMGVARTDTVVIHTSLRSVGETFNGAQGVLTTFIDYLRPGLFIVPTHTWLQVTEKTPFYDASYTPTCIGTLPSIAMRITGGVRSLHPTHSVIAFGKRASEYVAGEEYCETPTPPDGCWGRLYREDAKILLIGVGQNRNTFLHAVDEINGTPDRISPTPFTVFIRNNGKEISHDFYPHRCSKSVDPSAYFVNFEKAFRATGAVKDGRFGDAKVQVCSARKCADTMLTILKRADHDLCLATEEIPEEWYN